VINIGGYVVDAALSEDHNFDSEVTSFPVERGANISDHIRQLPKSVTIEGIVSDTPIGRAGVVRSGVAALQEEGVIEAVPFSAEALDTLLSIQARGEPVTITTSLRIYENMALEKLSVPRDQSTGGALRFNATFTEIRIVENRRTRVRTATPGSKSKSRSGNKPAKPVARPPSQRTYWCVQDRVVFVKPDKVNEARSYQSNLTSAVWTDWRGFPSADYTQPLEICTAKKEVTRTSEGRYVTANLSGSYRELTADEFGAMESDAKQRAGVTELVRPIDSHTGRPMPQVDRPFAQDPLKPYWYGTPYAEGYDESPYTSRAAQKSLGVTDAEAILETGWD
jgi:hypothetical protein